MFASYKILFLVLLIVGLFYFVYHPGYYSDANLKSRFSNDRPDLEELVSLFETQPRKEIVLKNGYNPMSEFYEYALVKLKNLPGIHSILSDPHESTLTKIKGILIKDSFLFNSS